MKDRSPQASAPWCCEVTHVAASSRREAEMAVAPCLPAQQKIADPRDVQHGVPHTHQEQAQNGASGDDLTAAPPLHEQTEKKNSTSSDTGKGVCNSSSVENAVRLAASVPDEVGGSHSFAAQSSSAAAGPSLALSLIGPAGATSHSTAASAQGRSIPEKSFPSLPHVQRPWLTPAQKTDLGVAEFQAASSDAVNQSARVGSAGTQAMVPPAAVAPDIEVAGSLSAGAAPKQGRDPVARGNTKGPPVAASKTTAVQLLSGIQREAPSSGEKCLEEWRAAKRESSVEAWKCKMSACVPSLQHQSCKASPSSAAWRSHLRIMSNIVQREQLFASTSEKQTWEKKQPGVQPQKKERQEEAAEQQQLQPQEGTVRANGFQKEHTTDEDNQEKELKDDDRRCENLQLSRSLKCEDLQTRSAYVGESVNGQVPRRIVETTFNDSLSNSQLTSPSALQSAGAHIETAHQRGGAFGKDVSTQERFDEKKLYQGHQTGAFLVDAGAAAPLVPLRATGGETGNVVAGMLVATSESSAIPTDVCKAEERTVHRAAGAVQDSAVRKRDDDSATGRGRSVTSSLATVARTNSSNMEEESNSSETNFHSSCLNEKRGKKHSGENVVLREETENSIRSSPWSSSTTKSGKSLYCEKWMSQSWRIERQVDTVVEGGSTVSRSGRRGRRRRSNTCKKGVRSFCCSLDGISPTGLSPTSTRGIAGAGGAGVWDTAVLHGKGCDVTVGRNSSGDEMERSGGAKSEQRQWHRCCYQKDSTCGDTGKTRFSWLPSALLKIVVLVPRCVVAVRSCFDQRICGPQRTGREGDMATYREDASVEQPRQKQKFPQPPTDEKHQKGVVSHKREEGRTATDAGHQLECPCGKRGEEWKMETIEDSRALFECCMPSAPVSAAAPLGLSRYILLCVYTLQAFLTGCVYFGWPALSAMLYRSGAYAWLCSPSEIARAASDSGSTVDTASAGATGAPAASRLYLCNSQDAAVAPLFTVCHVSDCVMCVVAGYLTDRCSPKGVCMFGQSLHVVGWTLLACSSVHFPAYVPAMVFIGCGSATAYLPLLRVALLFPRSKATTIAILGAANTGSFAVPCILDAIWRHVGVRTNAAAAVAALATAAAVRGASSVSSEEGGAGGGTTAGVTDGTALLAGGSEGGGGWTFTDICLLYLGVGPLCSMLLAAFFLPTHRFSLVVQYQNARQGKAEKDEKVAGQKQRKRWCIISATTATPASDPATTTGADSLGPSTKMDTEEEGSNTPRPAPTWNLWNLCSYSRKGKRQSVHLQRPQKQREPRRSRRFLSPFYTHREQEDDREPRQRYGLQELQRSGHRVQQERVTGTGGALQLQVEEVMEQRASEEVLHESLKSRATVSEDGGVGLQRKEMNCRNSACNDGIVGDFQRLLEDKRQGKARHGCACRIDLSLTNRRGCSAERQQNTKGKTCMGFRRGEEEMEDAAASAQIEKRASDMHVSSRETWKDGGRSNWRHASRRNSPTAFHTVKPPRCGVISEGKVPERRSHLLADFFSCRKQRRSAAAINEEAASQPQKNWLSSEIPSSPSTAAIPPPQLSQARPQPARCLQQEDATITTSKPGKRPEGLAEPAGSDREGVVGSTRNSLPREGGDCTSAPDGILERGTHYRRRGAEAICCGRKPSSPTSPATESKSGTPKEKRITERYEGKEGHKPRWLVRWKFRLCGLCGPLDIDRQLTSLEKEAGTADDRKGIEQQNKGVVGKLCHGTGEDSVYENCPQEGTAEHVPLRGGLTKDVFRHFASLYQTEQTSVRDAPTQADLASKPAARSRTSTPGGAAALQSVSGADHIPSGKALVLNKQFTTPLPCVPTTAAQAILAATTGGEKPATAESNSTRAAPEETTAVATSWNAASPMEAPPDAQSATACTAAVPAAKTAAVGAAGRSRPDGCSACAERAAVDVVGALSAAPRVPFAVGGPEKALFPSTPEIADTRCVFTCAGPASDCSVGSGLPCIESPRKKATLFAQCVSLHFACLVFYSGTVSVAISFMQSSSSRLFSARVLTFMDGALPFSFIPCILLGRLIDMLGPFPVLLFMNSMGLVSYLCAASTPLEGVHYLSVLAFCVYVSLDSEQVYCYIEYTFRPEHFGRLTGLLLAIDGIMSLVSIPLYDHLTVRNLGGNPLPVAFGISGLLGAAYFLLGGLWLHRRKYPDPFGLLDDNSAENGAACSKHRAAQAQEEDAEVGASKTSSGDENRHP